VYHVITPVPVTLNDLVTIAWSQN